MRRMLCLLVGMYFRPPAKAILQHLPSGAALRLQPEPGNQYDENAIQVLFNGEDLPILEDEGRRAEREGDFLSQGFSEEEIRNSPEEWHLGYIAKSGGKSLQNMPWAGNAELREIMEVDAGHMIAHVASLAFGPAGEPLVAIEIED